MTYLWVFLGGGLGSVARLFGSAVAVRLFGETFPWETLLVNVSGSFVIGIFATLTGTEGRWLVSPSARDFVMIGICGGYTTFSSFSLQTLGLIRNGDWFKAGGNAALSFALCMAAVWLGHAIASACNTPRGL